MDSCHNPVDPTYIGPYKATRVWNDVISAFRQYLPCGRHRRYMKTFDNCFTGSSAVDWLLHYLKGNKNFNEDVSREKALSLLNKLYKAGIFDEVKVTKNMRHKQDVQENRLYKFLPASPSKMKIFRLPLAPRNDADVNRFTPKDKLSFHQKHDKQEPLKTSLVSNAPEQNKQSKLTRKLSILKKEKVPKNREEEQSETYPACRLISRVLTTREIKETWKTVFIKRLKKTLGVSRLGDIISLEDIDGYNVMHNCIYLNKSGIVTNIDSKDQLPQWVMSAMRCLARWPEPPEPGLPSYPGFEKDVFGVVKDYFLGLEEPLIPFNLYDVITNVFVMAGNNQPRHSSPHHGTEEESSGATSLWTSASLENIILNLTKKYCLLDNTEPHYTSNLELKPSSISRQWFGTQEDLRFVSHMDRTHGSYNNRTVFPSTDGMDMLSQSNKHSQAFSSNKDVFSKLHSHESHKLLSRTTRSAAEVFNGSNLNKTGILRKFGSTPNLKVSRYETAFGPDNRTVTRVFYQNGMTTDFGHEDDDESYSKTNTERACGEVRQSFCETENPAGCCFLNEQEVGSHSPHKSFTKSKSCIDITGCNTDQEVLENSHLHNISVARSKGMNSSLVGNSDNQRKSHSRTDEAAFEYSVTQGVESEDVLHSRSLNRGDFVTLQHKTVTLPSSNLVEAYGPGYRPPSYITQNGDLLSTEKNRHEMNDSEPVERCAKILTPQKNTEAGTPYKTSQLLSNFGPGFKPPRPRTQTRYSNPTMAATESIPDLLSAQHEMGQDNDPISTPNLNLSRITPFCSTRQKTGDFSRTNFINFPQTRLSEDRAKTSLQMVSLLLPPSSRRKLHLLFKMMVKMTSNPNLCLDVTQTTRSLVLGTFYPAILRSQEECDLDELVVLQLVSFMLDFFDDIFNPPADIKTQVSERLKIMQRPQVVYSPRPERTVRFCQQTTVDDFENQRTSTSHSALEQLLEGIIADGNLNLKEKKKHLKQFQRTYPTIYTRRFPNPESESAIFPPKSNDKPSLKIKSLSRLKGLRL